MSNKDMKRNDVRKMRMSNDEEMMRPDGTLNGKKTSKGRDRTTETNQAEYDDNGEKEKWSDILAPPLTDKAQQVYNALSNEHSKDYEKVKEVIFQHYDINEKTYNQRLHSTRPKENEAPWCYNCDGKGHISTLCMYGPFYQL